MQRHESNNIDRKQEPERRPASPSYSRMERNQGTQQRNQGPNSGTRGGGVKVAVQIDGEVAHYWGGGCSSSPFEILAERRHHRGPPPCVAPVGPHVRDVPQTYALRPHEPHPPPPRPPKAASSPGVDGKVEHTVPWEGDDVDLYPEGLPGPPTFCVGERWVGGGCYLDRGRSGLRSTADPTSRPLWRRMPTFYYFVFFSTHDNPFCSIPPFCFGNCYKNRWTLARNFQNRLINP